MPTENFHSRSLWFACALCCVTGAHAAGEANPYRLRVDNPNEFKLREEPGESYRLAAPWRAPAKAAETQQAAEDPVAVALRAQAQEEANSKRSAEMAAQPYSRQIERAARAARLDPALVHALIHVESRHSAKAVSSKGALGLMQVLPDTGARYGIDPGRTPEQNLRAGTRYLRDLMRRFDDRLDLVLAAYNAGEGAVERYAGRIPPYRETRDYVQAVLGKYAQWRLQPVMQRPLVAVPAAAATPIPAPPPTQTAAQTAAASTPANNAGPAVYLPVSSVTLPAAPLAGGRQVLVQMPGTSTSSPPETRVAAAGDPAGATEVR